MNDREIYVCSVHGVLDEKDLGKTPWGVSYFCGIRIGNYRFCGEPAHVISSSKSCRCSSCGDIHSALKSQSEIDAEVAAILAKNKK